MISHRELVERARSGNREAFAVLAEVHAGPMFRLARLILGSSAPAEDATQDAMLAAWRGLPRLRDPDRFEAWLRRLLVRTCYRQRRVTPITVSVHEAWTGVTADEFGQVWDRDQLERGFQRLPQDQRAALVLRFYLDLPLAEVALVLNVPEGTAKSRIHRGLSALRAALEADARAHSRVPEGLVR